MPYLGVANQLHDAALVGRESGHLTDDRLDEVGADRLLALAVDRLGSAGDDSGRVSLVRADGQLLELEVGGWWVVGGLGRRERGRRGRRRSVQTGIGSLRWLGCWTAYVGTGSRHLVGDLGTADGRGGGGAAGRGRVLLGRCGAACAREIDRLRPFAQSSLTGCSRRPPLACCRSGHRCLYFTGLTAVEPVKILISMRKPRGLCGKAQLVVLVHAGPRCLQPWRFALSPLNAALQSQTIVELCQSRRRPLFRIRNFTVVLLKLAFVVRGTRCVTV